MVAIVKNICLLFTPELTFNLEMKPAYEHQLYMFQVFVRFLAEEPIALLHLVKGFLIYMSYEPLEALYLRLQCKRSTMLKDPFPALSGISHIAQVFGSIVCHLSTIVCLVLNDTCTLLVFGCYFTTL